MSKREIFEVIGSALTLGISLWVAFGPLRHRLPRFLTRLAKYSVALKLLTLSGLCWWGLYANVEHHGYRALRWGLTVLGLGLIGGAAYVLSLKPRPAPAAKHAPPSSSDAARAPNTQAAANSPAPAVHTLRNAPAEPAEHH